jgi:CheY-like chemotaxis protein
MPQLNGWDLAAQLKADASTAYARIFAITGYSRAKDRQRSEALGIDAHLVKPLAFSEILDLLNSHTSASILKRLA